MPTPPLELQPAPPLQCGLEAALQAAFPVAQEGLFPRKLEPWDPKGNEFPALSAGGGKRVDWRRVRANTLT